MSAVNIFELATRQRLRFDTPKGALSVEDLWQLPLTSRTGAASLDGVAVDLYRELQAAGPVSFVESTTSANQVLAQLKFDIVKHMIDVRKAESEAAATARQKAETRQKLMGIIDAKRDADLQSKTVEELQAMLAATA